MSLVAYAASSDEESSDNEVENVIKTNISNPQTNENQQPEKSLSMLGQISDDDDDDDHYEGRQEMNLQDIIPPSSSIGRISLALPKPKISADEDVPTLAFAKLPLPRSAQKDGNVNIIQEEVDDEFLHKKEVPTEILEKPPPPPIKGRVKITIPSLRDFSDVDMEKAEKQKNKVSAPNKPKGCGLLSILPQANSERNFAKKSDATIPTAETKSKNNVATKPAFIPDTVKHRRAAYNTEGVDGVKPTNVSKKNTQKPPSMIAKPLVNVSDSEGEAADDDDDDDNNGGDFFSLNCKVKLPEVSTNEISALVAKQAAKIVETSNKYLEDAAEQDAAELERLKLQEAEQYAEQQAAQKRYYGQQLNTEAMDALVGKNAKRRRKETHEMKVIDISGSDVLPDREEWMRTALASSTTYQPTGVLTDDEPVAGTRRKHQITYLAHKAKANEAELQAMWAANRQTRRATQGKYGF